MTAIATRIASLTANRLLRTGVAAGVLTLALVAALGCRVDPIELPAPQGWHHYENATLGVAFDVPDFLETKSYGDEAGIAFRYNGANAVLLRFVDAQEGKRRGLWHGHPDAGPITLGGRAGKRYQYVHDDGPIWDSTDAYVVPYRGKELGLEFRTRNDAAVRERMLSSFRFLEPASPAGG
jgi:hypothetical protein